LVGSSKNQAEIDVKCINYLRLIETDVKVRKPRYPVFPAISQIASWAGRDHCQPRQMRLINVECRPIWAKVSWAQEPTGMLGGPPTREAIPATLRANPSGIKNLMGFTWAQAATRDPGKL